MNLKNYKSLAEQTNMKFDAYRLARKEFGPDSDVMKELQLMDMQHMSGTSIYFRYWNRHLDRLDRERAQAKEQGN